MRNHRALALFPLTGLLLACGSSSSSPSDAGIAPDAGSVTPDAGSVTPDAGSVTPDAGSVTPDAGSVTPDAGSVTPDAGPVAPVTDAGTLTTVATGVADPTGIAIAPSGIYWTNDVDPGSVEIYDGGTATIFDSQQHNPSALTNDGNVVCWVTAGTTTNGESNNDGTVMISGIGEPPSAVASGQATPLALAIWQGSTVFWTTTGTTAGTGQVLSASVFVSGTPVTIASGQVAPGALAVDANNVYWATGDGNIIQAPKGGSGTAITLASNQLVPNGIFVDSTNVYWTNEGVSTSANTAMPNSGSVVAIPIGGGTQTTWTNQDWPISPVVQNGTLYWVNSGTDTSNGSIVSVPVTGGTPTTLVSSLTSPWSMALSSDGSTIAWVDLGVMDSNGNYPNGSVFSLALGQ